MVISRPSDAAAAPETHKGTAMSQLALVCPTFRESPSPATQWAHDIRNTLTTVGLHLDMLERLAGTRGHKAVEAAHALMMRATAMCEQALAHAARAEPPARRQAIDIVKTVRQAVELLGPVAPDRFAIHVHADAAVPVVADAEQSFRIVFNLLHNAVTLARRNAITSVDITVERRGATVVVRIADDGPGLPAKVRQNLFRPAPSSTDGRGIGLTIARELAERNGGMLELAPCDRGTTFALELPAAPTLVSTGQDAVTRSLGRRALPH